MTGNLKGNYRSQIDFAQNLRLMVPIAPRRGSRGRVLAITYKA